MTETLSAQERLEQEQGLIYPPEAAVFLEMTEMGRTDGITCWRSEEVERREGSEIEGRGLFAVDDIDPNTLIAIKPGHMISSRDVKDNAETIQGSQQQIGPNAFLAGLTEEEVDKNLVGYNHSCDPNAKVVLFKGASLAFLATRQPVSAGQEITVDYSVSQMTNTHLMKICRCGSPDCRGVVAPLWDWEDKDLQARYAGEFAWYIQDAMDEREQMDPERRAGLERTHQTLKQAGMTVLVDEEVKRLETQREEALSHLESGTLRSLLARIYDRSAAGKELDTFRDLRLRTAAYFSAICQLANIEEIGVDRQGVVDALQDGEGAATDELKDLIEPSMEEIVRFARNLDYFFNN